MDTFQLYRSQSNHPSFCPFARMLLDCWRSWDTSETFGCRSMFRVHYSIRPSKYLCLGKCELIGFQMYAIGSSDTFPITVDNILVQNFIGPFIHCS